MVSAVRFSTGFSRENWRVLLFSVLNSNTSFLLLMFSRFLPGLSVRDDNLVNDDVCFFRRFSGEGVHFPRGDPLCD